MAGRKLTALGSERDDGEKAKPAVRGLVAMLYGARARERRGTRKLTPKEFRSLRAAERKRRARVKEEYRKLMTGSPQARRRRCSY